MTLVPDPSVTFEMFDRVVNVRQGYSVPLGLRGTVIGIFTGKKEQEAMYEVVFDEEFLGGLTLRLLIWKPQKLNMLFTAIF